MRSYLTTADVATRLGVSLDTVRRWLRSGELKGTPFGRAGYRIEDADFQAFLLQRQRQHQQLISSSSEHYALSHVPLEEFMSAVSQELHMPLTTTRGSLQQAHHLLRHLLETPLSGNTVDLLLKLQDLLLRAERQMGVEMRLVGNLLDASRIQTNKFELSPIWCNLVELVRETVANQQELIAQRRFELELPRDDFVAVIADADRIKQALTNYLINAVKFSSAGQAVKISLQVEHTLARVSVQDQGSGIPHAEQHKIWEGFQRGQRRPEEAGGGLGLGLYITRTIIQRHRGQVGVNSQSEVGSTFWFTLPLADEV
ncbi:MAG TPA: ATP-binding protein [Ktedonobacteraceae bacterium]|nr:ATP-binding protein [Ktedonobacteraceae bacterium]